MATRGQILDHMGRPTWTKVPTWTPREVRSARLILNLNSDASQMTLVSSVRISTWFDQSGTGRNGSQGTDGNRLLYNASGGPANRPYVSCGDGSVIRNVTFGDVFSSLTAAEIFIVRRAATDPSDGAFGQTNRGGLWRFGSSGSSNHVPFTDSVVYDDLGSTVRKTTVNPTPSLTNWHIYSVITRAGEWSSYINGVQIFTTGTNTVGWNTAATLGSSLTIANDGGIAEVWMFDGKLSDYDRTRTVKYLTIKNVIS